jgi:hypothetical protein
MAGASRRIKTDCDAGPMARREASAPSSYSIQLVIFFSVEQH